MGSAHSNDGARSNIMYNVDIFCLLPKGVVLTWLRVVPDRHDVVAVVVQLVSEDVAYAVERLSGGTKYVVMPKAGDEPLQ